MKHICTIETATIVPPAGAVKTCFFREASRRFDGNVSALTHTHISMDSSPPDIFGHLAETLHFII